MTRAKRALENPDKYPNMTADSRSAEAYPSMKASRLIFSISSAVMLVLSIFRSEFTSGVNVLAS